MARFLIIEDSPESLDLMVYLLEAHAHTVFPAHDGPAGLAVLAVTDVDLLVCDVQLPTTSGLDVVRRLRADPRWRGLPAVAVTAEAQPGDEQRILRAGFDGYLTKPIDPTIFVQQLLEFLPPRP